MKRRIIVFLFIIVFISKSNIYEARDNLFTDTKSSDWFLDDVSYLTNLDCISGYPDGSFRPSRNISKAEFLKTLMSSIGYQNLPKTDSYWASGYVDKGLNLNLIDLNYIRNINNPITRYEMAKILSNTLDYKKETIPRNRSEYKTIIVDIDKIVDKDLYNSVLTTYTKGILSGYPDGRFLGDRHLSRAEASTVIVRVINKDSRVKPNLDKSELDKPKLDKPNVNKPELDNQDSFSKQVLKLVNIERKKEGIHQLKLSNELNSISILKSQDMNDYGYFSHTSPNYGSPFDLLRAENVKYNTAGENIALGQRTPKQVVSAWMNSPGHRRNILNPAFNKMGIGVYFGNSVYWTQIFTN